MREYALRGRSDLAMKTLRQGLTSNPVDLFFSRAWFRLCDTAAPLRRMTGSATVVQRSAPPARGSARSLHRPTRCSRAVHCGPALSLSARPRPATVRAAAVLRRRPQADRFAAHRERWTGAVPLTMPARFSALLIALLPAASSTSLVTYTAFTGMGC